MTAVASLRATTAGGALLTARAAAIVALIGTATSPPLANIAAAITLAALLAMPDGWQRVRRVLAEPLGRAVLVLAGALGLAFVIGLARGEAAPGAVLAALLDWRHLLLLIVALAVFNDARWKTRLAVAFVVFAAVAGIVTVAAWLQGITYKEYPPGVLLRNTVTQVLAFAVGAFLALMLVATRRVGGRLARAALGLAAIGLIAHLVFLSVGRSGFVALVVMVAVGVMLMLRGRQLAVALIVLPLLAALAIAASPRLQQRFQMGIDEARNADALTEYTSLGMRTMMWRTTAELIAERPLLGYGLGGFPPAYAARVKQHNYRDWQAITTTDAHNQYAMLWVEGGLPLLMAFAWFLFGATRQAASREFRAMGVALLGAWCVTSLVSSHFQTFNEGHMLMLLLGALLAREQTGAADQIAQPANAPSTAVATSS